MLCTRASIRRGPRVAMVAGDGLLSATNERLYYSLALRVVGPYTSVHCRTMYGGLQGLQSPSTVAYG